MLAQLNRLSRVVLAAGLVAACSSTGGQPDRMLPVDSDEEDKCVKAQTNPSDVNCWACLTQRLLKCDADFTPGGASHDICTTKASESYDRCIAQEGERPGGVGEGKRARVRIDLVEEESQRGKAQQADVRQPHTVIVRVSELVDPSLIKIGYVGSVENEAALVPLRHTKKTQWQVLLEEDPNAFDNASPTLVEEMREYTSRGFHITMHFDASDLPARKPGIFVLTLTNPETGYPQDVAAFTLVLTDSYDLNSDGTFDDLDRGIAMNRHAAGEMDYNEMAKIVNAK